MSASGVIAAGDAATAEAGATALRAGGNAVDAAVAAGFACFTAETMLATPGGGGMMVVRHPERGLCAIDLFCRAPGGGGERAAPARLDFGPVEVDFGSAKQIFHVGRGAAAPPTAVAGLLAAHARFGRLPLADVLAPAVRVAHEGAVINPGVAFVIKLLEPIALRSAASRALYARDGRLLCAGDRHANPALGDVIERIAEGGVDPLTRGDLVAPLVREFGAASGGLITEADLRGYQPVLREPLVLRYAGRTVVTCPPPATGGLLIAATLARLEDVAARGAFLSAAHLRAVAGALREVARDRARIESAVGSTTQISVLDASGGAAALTLSSGECCGEVLSGTGIHLNNFLGEEDINPGGFHRHAPGAPIPTMMSPTLVLGPGGEPELALGSGGSNRLRSAIAQAIVNLIAFDAPLHEAVRAPRLHVEGADLAYERVDLPDAVADALEVDFASAAVRFPAHNMYFGGVHVAARRGGRFEGAGDARRGGAAIVVE